MRSEGLGHNVCMFNVTNLWWQSWEFDARLQGKHLSYGTTQTPLNCVWCMLSRWFSSFVYITLSVSGALPGPAVAQTCDG